MGSGRGQAQRALSLSLLRKKAPLVWSDGTKEWHDEHGERHRAGAPALVHPDGEREWYQHGQLHRVGGPAQDRPSGYKAWYQDGELHRDDGPAIVQTTGTLEWYVEGLRHRED